VDNSDNGFSKDFKFAVSRKFFDHDGSLSSPPIRITMSDIGFLEGICAVAPVDSALSRDAEFLIEKLQEHGEILLEIK
jgi:hypothetical protein